MVWTAADMPPGPRHGFQGIGVYFEIAENQPELKRFYRQVEEVLLRKSLFFFLFRLIRRCGEFFRSSILVLRGFWD
jgi:hypothetical protein